MRSIFYVELWMAQNKMSSFISIALIICVHFCISARNKPALLMAGVLETVLLLLSSDTMAVVFKLLGVLRMLVDGQGEKRSTQSVQFSWMKTLWCKESMLVNCPRFLESEEVQVTICWAGEGVVVIWFYIISHWH